MGQRAGVEKANQMVAGRAAAGQRSTDQPADGRAAAVASGAGSPAPDQPTEAEVTGAADTTAAVPAADHPRPPRPDRSTSDRWMRRGIAAVGCLLLLGIIGGSDAGSGPATHPGTAAPTAGNQPTTSPSPTAPAVPTPVLAEAAGATGAGTGTGPTAAGVAASVNRLLADTRLGSRVSAIVVDATSGTVLLDHGAAQFAEPASTAKLATATAVLATMRADARLTTQVRGGAAPGEVVLVGGGDATLSAAGAATPTVYPGAARIATLAAQVRKNHPGAVTRIVVDGSLFSGPRTAAGWLPEDIPGGYVTPITAVMVDGGRQSATTARSADPDLAAGHALARALGVPAAAVVRGTAPASARLLGQVRSAPVVDLVEVMLEESDNVLAEALARQVAIAQKVPVSFVGAAQAIRTVLGGLGVPSAGLRMVDGSGLSGQDRLRPQVLAAVLRAAVGTADPRLHSLVPALPVGGYDGTLDKRYRTGTTRTAAGRVRAKTGTLDGVSALAGLASDRTGRLLVFAVLADRVPIGGTLAAEAALDQVAAALTNCGCG